MRSDVDLGDACVVYCTDLKTECVEQCFGNRNCIAYCSAKGETCANSCPCHGDCLAGCAGCASLFCQCTSPESNVESIACETHYTAVYVNCASNCGTDIACNGVCCREFEQNLKHCPCQENCASGCPCPVYQCAEKTSTTRVPSTTTLTTSVATTQSTNQDKRNIFVAWDNNHHNGALITNSNGDEQSIKWEFDNDTSAWTLCSLIYQNDIYFLGRV